MKQTAVEWLFEQLCSEKLSWNKDSNGKLFFDKITSDILQQAKAMEKEQITNAYVYGSCYGIDLDKGLHPNNYFKEIYKGGEQ